MKDLNTNQIILIGGIVLLAVILIYSQVIVPKKIAKDKTNFEIAKRVVREDNYEKCKKTASALYNQNMIVYCQHIGQMI
jgi:hypothetical protein